MNGRELARDDRVERPEQIELPAVIGGGVAKHRDLYGHTGGTNLRRGRVVAR